MNFSKSFLLFLNKNVKIYIYIYTKIIQGVKISNQLESIFSKSSFPQIALKDLSIYYKYNLKNDYSKSARKIYYL